MFGWPEQSQAQAQPNQRMSWQEYLDAIKNGPAPQYSPPSSAQSPQTSTAAGIGGASPGRSDGLFGGIMGNKLGGSGGSANSRIPATPVDYDRMHQILNSGVLTGGHAQTAADIAANPPPAQPAPAPTPAPTQPKSPFQSFMDLLMQHRNAPPPQLPQPMPAGQIIPPDMLRQPNNQPQPEPNMVASPLVRRA